MLDYHDNLKQVGLKAAPSPSAPPLLCICELAGGKRPAHKLLIAGLYRNTYNKGMEEKNRQKRQAAWLVIGSFLWSCLTVLEWVCHDDYLSLLSSLGPFKSGLAILLALPWYGVGLMLLILGIIRVCKRERLAFLLLLNILIAPLVMTTVDGNAIVAARWQMAKPRYERERREAFARPFDAFSKEKTHREFKTVEVRLAAPNVRLVRNQAGHVRVSFVRHQIMDASMAIIYDPQDTLPHEIAELNKTGAWETWALSTYGALRSVKPLGDHWYRCRFS
jgi:hypothetical protein